MSCLLYVTDIVHPEDEHFAPDDIHERRGSIGLTSGLKPAQKLDPVWVAGGESMKDGGPHDFHRHRGSIGGGSGLQAAEKLDPPEDCATAPKDTAYSTRDAQAVDDAKAKCQDGRDCRGRAEGLTRAVSDNAAVNADGELDCCARRNSTT